MMEAHAASEAVQMANRAALSILAAARAAHPLEACGLLIGPSEGRINAATIARNIAARREQQFEIDPGHLARWQRESREQGQRIIGCWHSHPNGQLAPSADDHHGAQWPGLLWLIVAGEAMALWRPAARGFQPVPLVRCGPAS